MNLDYTPTPEMECARKSVLAFHFGRYREEPAPLPSPERHSGPGALEATPDSPQRQRKCIGVTGSKECAEMVDPPRLRCHECAPVEKRRKLTANQKRWRHTKGGEVASQVEAQ